MNSYNSGRTDKANRGETAGQKRFSRFKKIAAASVALVAGATVLTACSSGAADDGSPKLRLGYFANLTHALPAIGVSNGQFQQALGSTKLETQTYNAGGDAITAINGGAIDAAFLGPNPAISAWSASRGQSIKIISGATSGGAQFIVKEGITADAASLKGKTFATPQLGNTQDVALRFWLKERGLSAPKDSAGDVTIQNLENAATLDAFKAGTIDGAWLPEPWSSRLVQEGAGKVLVDEASLWPKGEFVTTHLVVSQKYLASNPNDVKNLLSGALATLATIKADPAKAKTDANAAIKALTGKELAGEVLNRAWDNLVITLDPIASSLQADMQHGVDTGISKPVDLNGIYDLSILNSLLKEKGQPAVSAAGLGKE